MEGKKSMNTGDTHKTTDGEGRDPPARDELLRQAAEAARAGNMRGVLHALQQTEIFDGYLRRLQGRWPSLHEDDLSAVLWSEVVDEFYEAVRKGTTIVNVPAWLWKTAWNKTVNLHAELRRAGTIEGHEPPASDEDEVPVWDDGEEVRARRVSKAIELARELIPRLGEQTVQDVMRYIFDCYAAGQWEISNESIGAAVGLTAASARMWRSRGFQRLIREAAKERQVNPDFNLSQFQQEADGEDD